MCKEIFQLLLFTIYARCIIILLTLELKIPAAIDGKRMKREQLQSDFEMYVHMKKYSQRYMDLHKQEESLSLSGRPKDVENQHKLKLMDRIFFPSRRRKNNLRHWCEKRLNRFANGHPSTDGTMYFQNVQIPTFCGKCGREIAGCARLQMGPFGREIKKAEDYCCFGLEKLQRPPYLICWSGGKERFHYGILFPLNPGLQCRDEPLAGLEMKTLGCHWWIFCRVFIMRKMGCWSTHNTEQLAAKSSVPICLPEWRTYELKNADHNNVIIILSLKITAGTIFKPRSFRMRTLRGVCLTFICCASNLHFGYIDQ